MGCDIHMYCEEQNTINGVTEWRNADHLVRNHYLGTNGWETNEYEVVELCGSRNYSMFTALCGVRDYTDQSPKIDAPRGLPKDCCTFIKKASDDYGIGGHSHSFVSLKEVRHFVKENKPVKLSGLVRKEAAAQFREDGTLPSSWCQLPSSWCQGVSSDMKDDYEFLEWEDNTYQPLTELYELMAKRFRPIGKLTKYLTKTLRSSGLFSGSIINLSE